jgi:hypothetical protein
MVSRAVVVGLAFVFVAGCAREARVVAPTIIVVEPVSSAATIPIAGHVTTTVTAWAPKEEVEVEWQGSWWPAILMERRGVQHWLVHYEGYGDEWDEVVAETRIRERRAEPKVEEEEKSGDADP